MATRLSTVLMGTFPQLRYELDVVTASAAAPRAAFRAEDPDLAGYVILEFPAFDWLEDDEEIIGQPP